MRSVAQKQLVCVHRGGICATPSRTCPGVYIQATLRHFDTKVSLRPKTGSLIPWERRLAKTEISIFQEVIFRARFGNRDYDRPYLTFLVTLCRFD